MRGIMVFVLRMRVLKVGMERLVTTVMNGVHVCAVLTVYVLHSVLGRGVFMLGKGKL